MKTGMCFVLDLSERTPALDHPPVGPNSPTHGTTPRPPLPIVASTINSPPPDNLGFVRSIVPPWYGTGCPDGLYTKDFLIQQAASREHGSVEILRKKLEKRYE